MEHSRAQNHNNYYGYELGQIPSHLRRDYATLGLPPCPPPPYSHQAIRGSLFPSLRILEGSWNFHIAMSRKFRLFGSTEENYEISFLSPDGRKCLTLKGSKAADRIIRFQDTETGTFAFNLSLKDSSPYRKVVSLNLQCGTQLGKAEELISTWKYDDVIWDHVSPSKFVTNKIRDFTSPGKVLIRDASTKKGFARVEKTNTKNCRTVKVTNTKTTPVQKALFLAYAILRLKHQNDRGNNSSMFGGPCDRFILGMNI